MNRTDRLLAIVLELQRRRRDYCRAEDLAARFEVSKRTIYRDIQALCEAGVPIVAADRQGYALVEGYFLPPLRFTPDEALILALGSEVVGHNFDAEYHAAAQSAYRKIDAVLPASVRGQVDQLQRGLQFGAPRRLGLEQLMSLRELRHAVAACRSVRLHYSRRDPEADSPAHTVREVDPYRLTRLADDWYLTGYCHLRQAVRVFRVARIDQVALLDRTFAPVTAGEDGWGEHGTGQPIFVQLLADPHAARWVREAHQDALIDEETTSGGVQMTLLLPPTTDLVRRLLHWGGDVRVLEPDWLQARLIAHAERMLANYSAALGDD